MGEIIESSIILWSSLMTIQINQTNQFDQINQNLQTEPYELFETIAQALSQSNDYRVLKRFEPVKNITLISMKIMRERN